ncbi:hypothetical protein AKO1_001655 [Acrasis kona]|uniref:Uncharacterized protein n=1 Tax=Acrasis kona TaxID=1008807 RepID=A0AAW2ZBG6_9EUKA
MRPSSRALKEVTNKGTILKEINSILNVKRSPAIEYLYVEPAITFSLSNAKHSSSNPYGHAAIRYRIPNTNEESVVMNIVGKGGKMVHFLKPEDYLFGDPIVFTETEGNEQGGIYNRHMIGFRVEEWPDELLQEMHNYYQDLSQRDTTKDANFSLVLAPITGYNYWSKLFWPFVRLAERGNCSYWTSNGLQKAEVIKNTMFPKNIAVKMYWKALRKYPDNFNIVSYRSPLTVDENGTKIRPSMSGWLKPFWWLESVLFEKLDDMANVVVSIDSKKDGDLIAKPELRQWHSRPFWKRPEDK